MMKKHPPVTIITGENGTGKTIILDAIRGMLGINHFQLERNIVRNDKNFRATITRTSYRYKFPTTSIKFQENKFFGNDNSMANYFINDFDPIKDFIKQYQINVLVDYFNSKLSSDSFEIKSVAKSNNLLINNLSDIYIIDTKLKKS